MEKSTRNWCIIYGFLFFLQILKSFEFPSPMLIQAYGWPGILKLNNVVGISPVKTGKTFTYLCPLVSELLQTQTYKELAVGNGVSKHNKAFDRCIWHLYMYTDVLLIDSIWCKSLLSNFAIQCFFHAVWALKKILNFTLCFLHLIQILILIYRELLDFVWADLNLNVFQ